MGLSVLEEFARAVGTAGPVAVAGGRSQWEVGGPVEAGVREVVAPSGVVEHRPEEMIVRVRAGTPVLELEAALAERGQMVPLDPASNRATVGGTLAVGHSGWRRLRHGPVRDHVLEIRYVSAEGVVVRAGAPVVKNVTGFDLPRLMVGSLGTLGFLGEVVLRTYPLPRAATWLSAPVPDPAELIALAARLYRPSSVLWNGAQGWVLLEGHGADLAEQASRLGPDWQAVDGPPERPRGGRISLGPAQVAGWAAAYRGGGFVAEMGVGLVHVSESVAPPAVPPGVARLNQALKARFDPTARLNPGRRVLP